MTTREPERDWDDPERRSDASVGSDSDQGILADRVMHPEQDTEAEAHSATGNPVGERPAASGAGTEGNPSEPQHEDVTAAPTAGGAEPQHQDAPAAASPAAGPADTNTTDTTSEPGDSVTTTQRTQTPQTEADDRTQVLPSSSDTADQGANDRTQVIGPVGDQDRADYGRGDEGRAGVGRTDEGRTGEGRADQDRGELDRTRTMPVVHDDASARSTDREAARARAAARGRSGDEVGTGAAAGGAAAGGGVAGAAVQPTPAPAPRAEPRVVVRQRKHITDRFDGAVALFILRLATAAIMGTWGVQMLMNLGETRDFFGKTMLPYAHWAALVTAVANVLIALALIIGLLMRVAGLGILLIAIGTLAFVSWAPFHLFTQGQNGFVGEFGLLLAAVGLLFLLVGGGGWGADRMFRSNKSKGLPEDDEDDELA